MGPIQHSKTSELLDLRQEDNCLIAQLFIVNIKRTDYTSGRVRNIHYLVYQSDSITQNRRSIVLTNKSRLWSFCVMRWVCRKRVDFIFQKIFSLLPLLEFSSTQALLIYINHKNYDLRVWILSWDLYSWKFVDFGCTEGEQLPLCC